MGLSISGFQTLPLKNVKAHTNTKKLTYCFKIFLILVPFISSLKAQVIEVSDIAQISSHITQDTLVLLDIDNTIIQLPQMLGTPEWFADFYKKKRAMGTSHSDTMRETVDIYLRVNKQSRAMPVDLRTAHILKNLQLQAIPVLGLTSRDDALHHATIKHLKFAKIDFNIGRFKNYQIKLSKGEKSKVKNGIIYTGGKHKGECLQEFLSAVIWTPKKIVFVDDQLNAIQEVEAVLKTLNIDFVGVRYGYLDDKVKSLNSRVCEIQLEHFNNTGQLLSDKDAMSILKEEERMN